MHLAPDSAFIVLALLAAHGTASSQTPVVVEPLAFSLGYRVIDGDPNSGGNYEAMGIVVSEITEMVRSVRAAWLVVVYRSVMPNVVREGL